MIEKVRRFGQVWRYLGPTWILYRAGYAAQLKSGALRRKLPATTWEGPSLEHLLLDASLAEPVDYLHYRRLHAPSFFFTPENRSSYEGLFTRWDQERTPLERAAEVGRGVLRFFDRVPTAVGFPPRWHTHPLSQESLPAERHWSEIEEYRYGDIKLVWEPSRFSSVYTLVRAYWRTGDPRFAEMFWQLVEDWRANNPPQLGPNWRCGQETSFRLMAWVFGLYGFLDAPATTAQRVVDLAQMVAVSAERVEANISYALSQRNNHGISEGLGLWTAGLLFPELRGAAGWREHGRKVLEEQGSELIYDDGSFAQHSMNYHRVMLHDYLWALRLGDLQKQPLSDTLRARVGKATALLYEMQDEVTGRVPCYGHNDGALILPLNNCDYQDYRPVIQALHVLTTGQRCFEPGPWDEDLLWLFGPHVLEAPLLAQPRTDLQAAQGGYYTLRSPSGFAFMRSASFQDRPAHADMLHVDLWWKGQNVALDPGSYSYNASDPWNNTLSRTAYHNTVSVDEHDQMERAGKFLWLPWLKSKTVPTQYSSRGELAYWEGTHNGYEQLDIPVRHQRGVLRIGGGWWLILDRLWSEGAHDYRLHWLFPDLPYTWDASAGRFTLSTVAGPYSVAVATDGAMPRTSVVRADSTSPRGWRAPYYNEREPAVSLDVLVSGQICSFWTLFGPGHATMHQSGPQLQIDAEGWQAVLQTEHDQERPIMKMVRIEGAIEDELRVMV